MGETPWFTEPPAARLTWPESSAPDGNLFFIDPNGERAVIAVTKGPTRSDRDEHGRTIRHVWHVDEPTPDGRVVVSPSIHFVGHFHSPNPVTFRLVDDLDW